MKLLALDIGERRTGVALFDPAIDFVIPLDTIHSTNEGELIDAVLTVAKQRGVTDLVVGLPVLPSGLEGSQARYSRACGALLVAQGFHVSFIDERFTTDRAYPGDGDAKSACILLNTYIEKAKKA